VSVERTSERTGPEETAHSTLRWARRAVPAGSAPMLAALCTSGLSAYAFLVLTARHLSPAAYAPLAAFWTLAFLVGPGIYVAVDQEMARAVSSRLALGRPTRPAITRVAQVSVVLTVILLLVGGLATPFLLGRAFNHELLLLAGFLLILPGYCFLSALVGAMNAFGRLRGSATVVAGEGLFRLAGCGGILLFGVRTAGAYGLAVGLAPFLAGVVGWRVTRLPVTAGPGEPWRPVSSAIALLVGGTVLNQFLLVIAPFIIKILAHASDQADAGRFLNAVALTRVPLFLFNAAIPILLPRFTRLAAAGHQQALNRLIGGVTAGCTLVFALVTAGSAAFGPDLLRILYGHAYVLPAGTIALLAAAAGLYCVATVLSLVLIATKNYLATTISWGLGVGCLVVTTVLGGSLGLLGRVTWGYLIGCLASTTAMAAFVVVRRPKASRISLEALEP
jgi:O-antigen/teichoic acid export membrane protein